MDVRVTRYSGGDTLHHFFQLVVSAALSCRGFIISAVRWKQWSLPVRGSYRGWTALCLGLLPAVLPGQDTITGRITACGSGAAVSYATVYHRRTGTGTLADATGDFQINLPAGTSDPDTLTASSVGYRTKVIPFRRQEAPSAVCLEAATIDLPTATATAQRFRRESHFGNRSKSRNIVSGWSVSPRNGAERGVRIRLPGKGDHILKIIRLHLAESTYDSLRLRFHFYGDAAPGPTDRPLHSWLVDVNQASGWVSVDVLADAVSLRDQVFVSVEVVEAWSDKPANQLFLSAGLLTEGLYFRDRPFGAWEQANAGLSLQIVTLRE